jgi:hypothetical protein
MSVPDTEQRDRVRAMHAPESLCPSIYSLSLHIFVANTAGVESVKGGKLATRLRGGPGVVVYCSITTSSGDG